ncbi:MAG: glycosyltransferase [Acidobacteriaceae bacterium]|nr:glycosyltransferase [Acidobacteriaceae bacterium]
MKIVICGLSISSAWGNGHATLLRGLFRALHSDGHEVHFFERDTPYYAAHRDATSFPFAHLHLYCNWIDVLPSLQAQLNDADAAMVTSYCADGVSACELITQSNIAKKIFYDMDTPVTLSRLERGEMVEYLPAEGLGGFDLVLSYTGGEALTQLRHRLHARHVAALYGWVDPEIHHPVQPVDEYRADLSYLGTFAADRQRAWEQLLLLPAKELPEKRFVVGGAMYSQVEQWPTNVSYRAHVPPAEHSGFYCSSRLTLNITRGAMAAMGYCPSGRLFEAAACGTPVLSDWWKGLNEFFQPGDEILIANSTAEAVTAIQQDAGALKQIGARAKQRALDCHTAAIRARQLIELIETDSGSQPAAERDAYAYEEA